MNIPVAMLTLRQAIIVLVAELWFCISNVECDANFTVCYNTTTEMHCFSKIVDGPVNFTEAQRQCSSIDATLPVIKSEEVQTLLETFISYLSKSNGIEDSISFYWTSANRIMRTNWQWLNSSVINELSTNLSTDASFGTHVASLARSTIDQQEVRLIVNHPAENLSFICEFLGRDCQSQNGNVLRYGDKCYVAFKENATWYDARNSCLMERGDLASFGDLQNSNIDFTQWLNLSNAKQYWVGARILWWLWKSSGNAEVRYTNWFHGYPIPLYSSDECVIVYGNSGIPAEINGWKTADCNNDKVVGVICHEVTSLDPSKDTTIASCPGCASSMGSFESSTEASRDIALGVGIGLGVGIPVVIAIIVIIVVCVKRRRKYRPSGKNVAANSDMSEMKDVQTDSLETKKDDDVETETGEKYWEVTKADSASTTNEVDQVIESSAPSPNNDVGTVYSAVQFVDETDPIETNNDDVAIDEHYGEVARNDSRSATSEVDQLIEPSESHSNNGDATDYSPEEIIEETYPHGDGTDYSPAGIDEQTYPHGDGTDYSPEGIDEQAYPLEPDMDDVITDEAHWDAARNDSSSATNEMDQVIESFESNTDNGDGTVYSAVEFVEGQDEDDLP